MCSKFPQIFPLNRSGSIVEGFINILNEEFYINLTVFNDSYPKKVKLRGTWRLQQLLQPVIAALEQHLTLCPNTEDMLIEIQSTVEQQLRSCPKSSSTLPPAVKYYEILLKHLREIGWNKVISINSTLDTVELKAIDNYHRQHVLCVHLPEEFPNAAPTFSCDLPEEFNFKWSSNKTLLDVFAYFESCVGQYSDFWIWMEEIDESTWVLEPEKPSRSDCKRRIALAPTASLLVIVNPSHPSSVPICHYMGPESIVAPLRTNFNQNIDQWDESLSLLTNLKIVLDIDFPSPLVTTKEEFCIECCICYAYKLNEALPDVICNEDKCKQPFHQACLYEWLKCLPTARHSFNTVFGDCPYCNMPIWCTVPEL